MTYDVYFWTIISIILNIVLYKLYPYVVGKSGEAYTKKELKKLHDEYLVLNDLFLKNGDKYCQIDHLIFSKYGIFVIETKQYNGIIEGNSYDKKWSYNYRREKLYVHNPVHQNYGHVLFLANMLNVPIDLFIPIVCITSRAKLKIQAKEVVRIYELNKRILSYTEEKNIDYQVLYNIVKSKRSFNIKEKRKHIQAIKQTKKEKEINEKNKCPKCGHDLVIRNGKQGQFIGCSNYPKCHYTKNIKM